MVNSPNWKLGDTGDIYLELIVQGLVLSGPEF